MSDIDIRHPHAMPAKQVRKAVEQVAGKLSERFGLDCNWEGDTLHFHRSGVDAFRRLGDAPTFMDEIVRRERSVAARLFAGDADPFRVS